MELEKKLTMKSLSSENEFQGMKEAECETNDFHANEIMDLFSLKKTTKRLFLASEEIYFSLHYEIIKFTSEVEYFNEKNSDLFKDLLSKITESIQKVLPDSSVI